MDKYKPKWLFPLFIIALTIAIFITDLITPLGLATWILYIAAVLISFNTSIKKFPQAIIGFIMLFMILGYLLSPPGIEKPIALLNYIIGVIIIWITFRISFKRNKAEESHQRMLDELEIRVNERTAELVRINQKLNNEIMEHKKAEIQLSEYATELKTANEIKDKFYAIVAHDLRGPFHSFLNVSELLALDIETLTTEEIRNLSSELNLALKRQYNLLTSLLDWTRLQSKKFHLSLETFLLSTLLNEVIDTLMFMSKQKEIELINNTANDLVISADKYMLKLVLHNLISNGVKFTSRKGMIKILADKQNGFVTIKVSDNGVGIAEEDLSHIFAQDVRYTTDGTEKESGSGLGLILCKEIVEKHGGTLQVESKVGKGTTFSFTIPQS
jgi:signal transduction histidine kinase